jgi:hypothetical protein
MNAAILVLALAAASPGDSGRTAIFAAAGFKPTAGRYLACDGRTPLALERRDLNGDGRAEAIVTDEGTECYGMTGTGFVLLTQSPAGRWTILHQSAGIPEFLATRSGGWPEMVVGGPGFCFPVLRWNGRAFVTARWQYDGKACKP